MKTQHTDYISISPRRRIRSALTRLLLVCTVLMSSLPLAGLAHTAANDDDSLGYTRPDWMGQLPDDTPFTELSVPGTHDTMAYDGNIILDAGIGQCQSVSLSKQLQGGIRALDIRCRHLNNEFPIHHADLYLNANFSDVMGACVAFLDAHPTEAIFMRISEEYEAEGNTRSFQATLMDYLDNYPPERIWETDDWSRLPSLGEIRGKIVLIGGSDDPELPQCSYKKIFDNGDWHIIDFWDKKDSYNTLWGKIKDHLIKANADRSSPKAFSTFISDYAYPITPWDVADQYDRPWPFSDIEGMNRRTYRYLRDLLNQGKYHRIGQVMMDFPGKALIDVIIAHNGLDRKLAKDPPVADAGGPYVMSECATIELDGSGSYEFEGNSLWYAWDFYDDGTWDTAWSNEYPYALFTAGDDMDTFVVLAVYDGTTPPQDGMDFDKTRLTVTNVSPDVVIDDIGSKIPDCIMPGHEVVFYGSFSDPGYMDAHLADWYFSEGGITAGIITEENDPPDATGLTQTTNSYPAPGIYTVSLMVTDDDDGTGWATTEVLVRTPAQVCEFMIEFIQSLDRAAFSHPQEQRRSALCNKLEALERTIDRRASNGSANKLANDLRTKWDGQNNGKKNSDWIIDPAAQEILCLTVDELILSLTP